MLVGYGFVLGSLIAAGLLRLIGNLGLDLKPWLLLSLTALIVSAAFLVFWRSSRISNAQSGQKPDAAAVAAPNPEQPVPIWQGILFGALLLWLLGRLLGLALELWWQPLFSWDAWTTWMVRARVWTELQTLTPFISPQAWLADPSAGSYTIDAYQYPETVSLLAAWPVLILGEWNESVAKLPWLGCAAALALAFFGQARRWGVSPLAALVAVWLVFSLPILDSHIALAGYADLWLATLIGLAFMAFLHWVRDRDWRQGALALALVGCLPLIKQEGAVWAGLFLPALAAVWMPWRWWLIAGVVAAGLACWVWLTGGVEIKLPLLGELRVAPGGLVLPYVGEFNLGYQGDWGPVWQHLFVRSSWHLFGYLLLLALAAAFIQVGRRRYSEPWSRAGLIWVLSALFAFYLLFFWTNAAEWAVKGTSINRIFLQFSPALMFWMLTLSTHRVPMAHHPSQSPPA
ncbi:hypothetical protein CKO42_16020 [Lamprobacter modestohalophilus]|uniref:Uncharacterized protein n=2 Tax=Lamprobacter modestohalophilus TaxID=1064514 RepID=A0A9X0WAN6_9GAMM|nr:hypothetical protein [Lamprobacter modestohalophilus]